MSFEKDMNPPSDTEARIVAKCSGCKSDIREGEDVWEIDKILMCKKCAYDYMRHCRKTAH